MMNFHAMNRKQLQALCKRHSISANLSNVEMANRLSSAINIENAESLIEQAHPSLKNGDGEGANAGDKKTENGVVKLVKKVRFNPQNEIFEYVRTDPRALRLAARRRNYEARETCSTEEVIIDRETKAEPSRRTRSKSEKVDAKGVEQVSLKTESELEEKRMEEGVNGVEQVLRRLRRMLGKTESNDTLDEKGVSMQLPVAKTTSGGTRMRKHGNEKIKMEKEDEREKNNAEQKGTCTIQKRWRLEVVVKVSLHPC